jgi:hypothetical protein
MKPIVPFTLFMVMGFTLAAGCVALTNKSMNPFSNTTGAFNDTADSTSKLKGSLSVSIAGFTYPENLSVVLDNESIGMVNPTTPFYTMVSEGNHTVMVCAGAICERENVTTKFGRYVIVDFSERLHRDTAIARPTARILDYYKNGNAVSVNIEFVNPSQKDHLMSVELSCGYSYIDDRTSIKKGDSARGRLAQYVKAGQRITASLDLYLTNGHNLSYDFPEIEELKVT